MGSRSAFVLVAVLAAPGAAWTQPYAFVSGASAETIGVIDLGSDTLVSSFALGGLPSGAAVTRDGTKLFVARSRQDSVAMIDTATGAVTSIPVGSAPGGVAFGGRPGRIYVANAGDDTVSVIQPANGVVVATIPVGDAPLALAAGVGRVFVANWAGRSVSVIDTTTSSVVASVPVGALPAGLAVDRARGRAYVANFLDDTVSVIDTATLSVVATVPVARRPRGLAVGPVTGRVYVAGFEDGVVSVIHPVTNTVVLQGSSGGTNPTDVLVGADGDRVYVTHLETGPNVHVLDAATLVPVTAISAPEGPVAIAGSSSQAPPPGATGGLGKRAVEGVKGAWARVARPRTAASEAPRDVSIVDGAFVPADWQVFFSSGGAQTTTQESTGGNPDFWRRTSHTSSPVARETVHRLTDPGRQYDPATQGPISAIDASWDSRYIGPGIGQESFVIVQGGVAYRADTTVGFSGNAWQAAGFGGLTAGDFDDGSGGQPDFSVAGSAISFGYYRRIPGSDANIAHGIDNFAVTVHTGGGGGGPGVVNFVVPSAAVADGESLDVGVDRQGGTLGAITATVLYTSASGSSQTFDLQWGGGDGAPKTFPVTVELPPPGAAVASERLRIIAVGGGAAIGTRDVMAVLVYPEDWDLTPLVLAFLLLIAAWSPWWLAAFAAAVLLLVVIRGRRLRITRRTVRRLPGLLLVGVLAGGLPYCLPTHSRDWNMYIPGMIWNDRLRLDVQPLVENSRDCVDPDLGCLQRSTDPWTGHYETREQAVVSEIYPELASDVVTRRLPKSDCLWTPHGQPVRVSWEAVIGTDPAVALGQTLLNGQPDMRDDADWSYGEDFYPGGLRWFSACRLTTPYDRVGMEMSQPAICEFAEEECPECEGQGLYWGAALINGLPFSVGCDDPRPVPVSTYVRRASVFDVDLRAAPYPDPRPGHNLCAPAVAGPDDASVIAWLADPMNCPVADGRADICGDKCLVHPDGDATLSVHSVFYKRTRALSPTLMAVKRSEPRRLVRGMQKSGAAFVWSTPPSLVRNDAGPPPPEAPSLRWEENFTPDLRVTQVRVLRINGSGETPLAPTRLRVIDPVGNGSVWDCPGEPDPGGGKRFKLDTSGACRNGDGPFANLPATPTYLVANVTSAAAPPLGAPLTWQADGMGNLPAGEVFIEFMVDNQACQAPACNALKVETPTKDLGRLQVGRPHFSVFEVTNVGPEPLLVDTLRAEAVSGQPDATADFGLEALCCPVGVPAPVEVLPSGLLGLGADFGANPVIETALVGGQTSYVRALDVDGAHIDVDGHELVAKGDPKFDSHRLTYTDPGATFSWAPTFAGGRRLLGEVAYLRLLPPFYVEPGRSFRVRVTTAPRDYGTRRARLRVRATAASNPGVGVWTESLHKTFGIAGPSLSYLPRVLSLPRQRLDAAGQVEHVWALNAIVSNYGGMDMQRTNVAITGPDAGRFRVTSTHDPAYTIPPRHDEVFTVAYLSSCAPPASSPPAYGPRQYEAQLRVSTSGGEAVVELRGAVCPQLGH